MVKSQITIILMSLLFFSAVCAEDISVSISQKKVGINESFTAVFTSKNQRNSTPDFSPLDHDFEIISKSQNQQTTIINDKIDQEISWNLVLLPKQMGVITIPSIFFGTSHSEPITIEVQEMSSSQQEEDLFLEVSLDPKESAYEQTKIVYAVRLYRAVNLAQGSFSDVEVNDPDALIEKLGEDLEYEHYNSNGKRYIVLEQKFAVFPQRAGELTFSPIVFDGRIISGRRSFFAMNSQYKRVFSSEEKITVKPVPPPFQKNNWFAAKDVMLTSEWSSDPESVVTGEPVTLTLTIAAEGTLGSQIPDFNLSFPKGLKAYYDKPQVSNQIKDEEILGIKQIKVALIPSQSGSIRIPEVQLKWWDLSNDQVKVASLPEKFLTAIKDETPYSDQQVQESQKTAPLLPEKEQHFDHSLPYWAWFLIALNGIWIAGLFIFLSKKLKLRIPKKKSPVSVNGRLRQACLSNDAKQAETLLLAWAEENFPETKGSTLMSISIYLSPELQAAVVNLYQALYGQNTSWKGEALWEVFSRFQPKKSRKPTTPHRQKLLRELYPE